MGASTGIGSAVLRSVLAGIVADGRRALVRATPKSMASVATTERRATAKKMVSTG